MKPRTLIILLLLLFLWAGPVVLGLYTDWLWFVDLGFAGVFRTRFLAQATLFVLGALLSTGAIMSSAFFARRLAEQAVGTIEMPGSAQMRAMERPFSLAVIGGGLFLALNMAGVAATRWEHVLRFWRAVPFGTADPQFGFDIGFFVFTLPVYRFLQGWLLTVTLLALAAAVAVYAFRIVFPQVQMPLEGETEFRPAAPINIIVSRPMRVHLFGLGAILLVLLAWGHWLAAYDLVYSPRGASFGASYADIYARLPALRLQAVMALVAAGLVGIAAFRQGYRLAIVGAVAWIGTGLLVGGIYPAVMNRFVVQPQELERERPYIERTIRMTRQGYALDRITEAPIAGEEMITAADLARAPATVANIRLWDPGPLLITYNQIQSIRLYYDFVDVDVDRYTIDGRYRQVMLAARELSPEKLTAQAQTWVNRRLQFTHGYGVAMSPVNELTPEGLPTLFLQDVPPIGKLRVDQPEVYYGEKSRDYVIVRTRFPEFNYPKGDENVYTTYQGTTGVGLGSPLRKLLFAWRFRDINILISDAITPESVILYHRNIAERVARLVPFLRLDGDPYVVVADGRLFWILDAYTYTDRYPYSAPSREGFNYVRNSVKAVVDAYNGTVALYVSEPGDAMIQTYARIFPGLFQPLADLPASLRPHLRYPQDIFAVQAEMYRVFHMQDPRVFYNKEDMWSLPEEIHTDKPVEMKPYYIIMRLPGVDTEEYALIMPFTPPGKQNMITWLAARSDGEHYGKLLAFRYPKDKLVYGPMQIEARINQDPKISEQFTLWSQGGNRVIRGNMIVIPIGQSNLYVEPIYLQAEQGRLPEMKRVVLASGNRVAMASTVSMAMQALLAGQDAPAVVADRPPVKAPVGAKPSGPAGTDSQSILRSLMERQGRLMEELKALDADLRRLFDVLNKGK
ncbi:MAG: UPF0182 family protein [bacterium]|nr:UPF0182 family protein [bacterium]